LTITGTASASNVIAIVFSPGPVIDPQNRSSTATASCTTTGTTILRSLCATNYLESENSNGAPPADNTYTTALASTTFNDQALPITREVLFPPLEMRVARELRASLRNYYAVNRYYPYAASFPGTTATAGTYRGYVPTSASTCMPGVADLVPYLPGYVNSGAPGWFYVNNWPQAMVYAVAPRCTPDFDTGLLSLALGAPQPACALWCLNILFVQVCLLPQTLNASVQNCTNAGSASDLTVTGMGSSYEALIMAPSYRLGSQNRPCSGIADCLEAVAGNNENIDGTDNYTYVKPLRSSTNNDNQVIVAP
jgi:hypothetical protein